MDSHERNKRDFERSDGPVHSSKWRGRDRSYSSRTDQVSTASNNEARHSEYSSRSEGYTKDKQNDRDWSRRHSRDRNYKADNYQDDKESRSSRWHNHDDRDRDRRSSSKSSRDHQRDRDRRKERDRSRDRCSENSRDSGDFNHREMDIDDRKWDGHRSDMASNNGDGNSANSPAMSGNRMFNQDSESYINQPPNTTIMIRGLAQHITENDIRQDILQCSLMPKDIRLIRKKDTGSSRGFAFVEFNTVQEASRWMELKQGVLMLHEQYRAVMHFSIPKETPFNSGGDRYLKCSQDWYCVKCGAHNFKRRDTCFKCQSCRQDSDGGEGSEEVTHTPTSTILLRGLDVLSTQDTITQAVLPYCSVPFVNIRIGQDSLTNTSRGLCYVEMNSIADASFLYNALLLDPPTIDGRKALISYYQPVTNNWSASEASHRESHGAGLAAMGHYTLADVPRLAEYSASLYATTAPEHAAYKQYYHQYYQNQLVQDGMITLPTQTDSVNAAAALAQAAIQQALAAKEIKKTYMEPTLKPDDKMAYEVFKSAQMKSHLGAALPTQYLTLPNSIRSTNIPFIANTPQIGSVYTKYPIPDVSTYHYDESSGYYYDSHTGLYYDATTQYYYNSQTQQFLYWEAELETYTPAPVPQTNALQSSLTSSSPDQLTNPNSRKDEIKKNKPNDKVKVAKKIAKDMERWAKTLNQKKDNNFRSVATPQSCQKSIGAADAGYAVLERKDRSEMPKMEIKGEGETEAVQTARPDTDGSGLVAAYGGGSDSDDEIEDVLQEERQHINWNTLACLLCKRQFANKETLMRHQQRSDLHKQNLTNWYTVRGLDPDDPQQRNNKYRDRAKERRLKFGQPNAPQRNRLKEKYLKAREDAVSVSYEEPTKAGIGTDNLGNKMLQKMGWQEGMGLGKANQGRTTIIQTKQRVSSAGLGVKCGTYGALPGETYKDCVKKMMFARYQELTEQEQEPTC